MKYLRFESLDEIKNLKEKTVEDLAEYLPLGGENCKKVFTDPDVSEVEWIEPQKIENAELIRFLDCFKKQIRVHYEYIKPSPLGSKGDSSGLLVEDDDLFKRGEFRYLGKTSEYLVFLKYCYAYYLPISLIGRPCQVRRYLGETWAGGDRFDSRYEIGYMTWNGSFSEPVIKTEMTGKESLIKAGRKTHFTFD